MGTSRVPDLDSLQLLLEVASTGSLGRAAVAHGLSQPAVTARIRGMERLVGVPLVERTPRGSRLTAAGALLADWARDVLLAADRLDVGMAALRGDREGRLRVAASQTVAEYLLPAWLVRLAADRPEVSVSLDARNSGHVASAVLQGDADIGFVEGPTVRDGLESQVIGSDRLVVVVPPGHPWTRRRRPVDASELAATRLVRREPHSGSRAALDAALAAHGPLAAPLLELSTAGAIRSAVAAGAGPAVLSELAVGTDLAAGRLVEITVKGADFSRVLRAVWPSGQRPSGPARALLTIAGRRHR
jgi:molybdate transport repressor ModE-like protein